MIMTILFCLLSIKAVTCPNFPLVSNGKWFGNNIYQSKAKLMCKYGFEINNKNIYLPIVCQNTAEWSIDLSSISCKSKKKFTTIIIN